MTTPHTCFCISIWYSLYILDNVWFLFANCSVALSLAYILFHERCYKSASLLKAFHLHYAYSVHNLRYNLVPYYSIPKKSISCAGQHAEPDCSFYRHAQRWKSLFLQGESSRSWQRRNRLDQTDVWDSRVHRYNDDYSERTVCLSATNYSVEFYQVLFATNGLAYIWENGIANEKLIYNKLYLQWRHEHCLKYDRALWGKSEQSYVNRGDGYYCIPKHGLRKGG